MFDNRTEAPTPKRKRDARRRGQVARSVELPQAASLVAAVVVLPMVVPRVGTVMAQDLQRALVAAGTTDVGELGGLLRTFAVHAAVALGPLIAAVALARVAAQVVLVGVRPAPSLLKPKFERIDPKAGVKRLVSKQALWELLRTTLKLLLVAIVAYGVWRAGVAALLAGTMSADSALATVGRTLRGLLVRVAALALLIGVADAVVALRRHRKSLRMTKQEVKDEARQMEGNPEVKGAIRRRQAKLSRLRMIAAVAQADVVLTNPTHLAVALAYRDGDPAPVVVAKGAGSVAKRIREEATRHGVATVENKPLARALFRAAEVGDFIPAALYRAVAEILALVWRAKGRRR